VGDNALKDEVTSLLEIRDSRGAFGVYEFDESWAMAWNNKKLNERAVAVERRTLIDERFIIVRDRTAVRRIKP
jgi:hypothetical protein